MPICFLSFALRGQQGARGDASRAALLKRERSLFGAASGGAAQHSQLNSAINGEGEAAITAHGAGVAHGGGGRGGDGEVEGGEGRQGVPGGSF